MKNRKQLVIGPLALAVAALSYLLTRDYLIAIAVTTLSIVITSRYLLNAFDKIRLQQERIAVAHQIIHAVSVDLSIKNSVYGALSGLEEHLQPHYLNLLASHDGDLVKGLHEIAQDLQIAQFHVFCKIIELLEQQGGAANMNYMVLGNIDNLKVKTDQLIKSKMSRVREIALMWSLTMAILIYMRFGLETFYLSCLDSLYFRYAIGAAIAFALVTIGGMFKNLRNVNLERGEIR